MKGLRPWYYITVLMFLSYFHDIMMYRTQYSFEYEFPDFRGKDRFLNVKCWFKQQGKLILVSLSAKFLNVQEL